MATTWGDVLFFKGSEFHSIAMDKTKIARLRLVSLSFLFTCIVSISNPAFAAKTIFEITGTDTESDAYGSGSYLSAIAQQYVAQSNELLCSVKHKVRQYDAGAGDLVLTLSEGGANPDAAESIILATAALPYSAISSSASSGYSTFALSDCVNLSSGKTYWFVFRPDSGRYTSEYRNTNQFSYSKMFQKNAPVQTKRSYKSGSNGWEEVTGEWSLKLEGPEAKEPVIIVPGILGSKLNKVSDGSEVWPNGSALFSSSTDSFLDYLILDVAGAPRVGFGINPSDISREVTIAGKKTNVYGSLIEAFKNKGYREGIDLFVLPYDWRLDIATSTQLLSAIVDEAIQYSPTGKVNIVAHSMGGLLVKEYLRTITDTSFVSKLVLVGVPEIGSPKAFKALTFGDNFGINFGPLDVLSPNRVKIIAQNMPAVYQLLPSRDYFSKIGSYIIDNVTTTAPLLLSFQQSRDLMLSKPSDSRNASLFSRADAFHQALDTPRFNVASSSEYRLSACQIPGTIGKIRIKKKDKFDILPTDGDGTVPLKSAIATAGFNNAYFALGSVMGVDHMGLVGDSRTVGLITDLITSSSTPILPTGIATSFLDCTLPPTTVSSQKTTSFSTHSPVTLHVYDTQGRHLGPNASGDIEFGIPGSRYERIQDNSFAYLPHGQTYRVEARATNTGSFDLMARVYSGSEMESMTTYLNVPLETNRAIATLTAQNMASLPALSLDNDGNGTADASIPATGVLSGAQFDDFAAPALSVMGSPLDGEEYSRTATFSIQATATDAASGVAGTYLSLDGANVATTSLPLYFFNLKLGDHILTANAYDKAGNWEEAVSRFKIYADATSTIADINRAYGLGWITKKSVRDSLLADIKAIIKIEKKIIKLEGKLPPELEKKLTPEQRIRKQIEKLETKIDKTLGKNFIGELDKRLKAKTITVAAYELLKEDAEWLMNN